MAGSGRAIAARQRAKGAGTPALIALLALLTFTAYLPALRAGFVWDDEFYAGNPVLSEPGGLGRIWTARPGGSFYYREFPLVYTSFWIERLLWGLDPTGFHVTNVALHLANALLVWMLLARLAVPGAWLAAAIFALHPLQVESVAWVSERKNLLCGLLFLAATLAYLRHEDGKGRRWYAASLLLFVGALLSKPIAAVLPVVLVLLRWARGLPIKRRDLLRVLPFLLLALAMGLFTLVVERGVLGPESHRAEFELSAAQRVLCAARAFWFYPIKMVVPVDLAFSYERWAIDPGDAGQWLWVLLTVAAAAAVVSLRGRIDPRVLAGLGYYTVSIAPMLGIVDLYTFRYAYVADHYQYLAGIGLIATAAGSLTPLVRTAVARGRGLIRSHPRWVEAVVAAAVLAPLWAATWRQGHDYENAETLWRNTVRRSPGSILALNELGAMHYGRGEVEQAVARWRQTLAANPDHYEANNNMGVALVAMGRLDEAAGYARRAMALKPRRAPPHKTLGDVYARLGRVEEAAQEYRRAISLKPDYAEAYVALGDLLLAGGRRTEAVLQYDQALAVRPGYPQALRGRAAAVAR